MIIAFAIIGGAVLGVVGTVIGVAIWLSKAMNW